MALSDLAERADTTPWRTCVACHALDNAAPEQAKLLRELLANPAVRYTALSTELASDPEWLLDIDPQTLARHARGHCSAREKLR